MRKKSTKTILIVAACLLGVGLLLIGAALRSGVKPLSLIRDGALRIPAVNLGLGPDADYRDWSSAYQPDGVYTLSAEGLTDVDLRWLAGQVQIQPVTGSEVRFSEKTAEDGGRVSAEDGLQWGVENGVLYIQHCRHDAEEAIPKTLTLALPQALAEALTGLRVDTISAAVSISGVRTETLRAGSTSGSIHLEALTAGTLELTTVSGSIRSSEGVTASKVTLYTTSGEVGFSGDYTWLDCHTVSGSLDIGSRGRAESTALDSVSGDIRLGGSGGKTTLRSNSGSLILSGGTDIPSLTADTTSGRVALAFLACPQALSVDTISGEAVLTLPADSGFTLHYRSVSGELESDFPVALRKEAYVAGDGSAELQVETTSGDLHLRSGRG